MRPKNKLLLFIAACIPGCGQMYQGYMKRGISMMSVFAAIIAVASWLYLGQLALALPVLWLYAFFDTYNLRRALENDTAAPDQYPCGLCSFDREQLERLFKKRHSLLGWGLVLVGGYSLLQMIFGYFSDYLRVWFGDNFAWHLTYDLPRIAALVLVVALGLWFIRGPKQKRTDNDDGYSYTPPQTDTPDASPAGAAPDGSPEYRDVVDGVLHGGAAENAAPDREDRHDGE